MGRPAQGPKRPVRPSTESDGPGDHTSQGRQGLAIFGKQQAFCSESRRPGPKVLSLTHVSVLRAERRASTVACAQWTRRAEPPPPPPWIASTTRRRLPALLSPSAFRIPVADVRHPRPAPHRPSPGPGGTGRRRSATSTGPSQALSQRRSPARHPETPCTTSGGAPGTLQA